MAELSPRLVARGHWGVPETPALAVNLTTEATWQDALKSGGVRGLRLYRKGAGSDGITQPAIGLAYKNLYSETYNTTAAWTATLANPDDFATIANAFDSNVSGLLYANSEANAAATFVSGFTIDQNHAFCIRFFLFTPHEDQPRQIVALMWYRWRLEIEGGRPSLLRTSLLWTEAKQLELDTLLNTEGQLSTTDQSAADALRAEIYEDGFNEGISVSEQKTDFGSWFEITMIPEPRGLINIITNDGETAIEVPEIIATRRAGVLWPARPLTLTTNGGAMFWQVGFPDFARAGRLRPSPFKWRYATNLSDTVPGDGHMTFRGQSDDSSPGVSLALSLRGPGETGNSLEYQVQADFTSDGNYSPFLYAAEGFVEATTRTGSDETVWDSDTVSDFDTNGTPIKELAPSYESDMRRRSCTLTLRNVSGKLLLPGMLQEALHDRICDVTLGGDPFITRGIVISSQLSDMKQATANQAPVFVTNRWSEAVFEIGDQWAVMDADTMLDNPKGDGLRLGAYLRLILSGAGVTDAEMTGISSGAGRILPGAAPGEDWLIQPGADCSRGDWLRRVVTDWGMGLILSISRAGIWTLAAPDTTVRAAFSSSATSGYRILAPLDIVRDFGDSYNFFVAEGAEVNGVRLRQTWRVTGATKSPLWAGYTGRRRVFPTIRADYCRTASDLQWVLRSNVRAYAKPGRWFSFETNFHKDLDIGNLVTLDGVECEIESIDGGSILYRQDRMSLLCREVIDVGA